MFTFSTNHVINTDKGNLTGGKNYYFDSEKNALAVERMGTFKKDNIEAVYKRAGYEAANAKMTIDFGKITASEGDNLRLDLYMGLSAGSADSRFSNDLAFKGKPLSVDFVWKASAEATLAALKKTIDNYEMLVYGSRLLKATVNGTLLTLEATDEYQRFKKMEIQKYTKSTTEYPYAGTYTTLVSLDDMTKVKTAAEAAASNTLFVGKEGFGTYSFILHNLRIPTSSNVGPFVVGADEAPIVGGVYDQITIRYCVDRGPLGMNAVNQNVKSVTTHVFYVLNTISAKFIEAIQKMATVTEVTSKEDATKAAETGE